MCKFPSTITAVLAIVNSSVGQIYAEMSFSTTSLCRCSCWTANHYKPSLCQAQFASQHLGTTYGNIVQNAPMAALVHDGEAGHKDPCAGQRQQGVVVTPGVEVMHMWHQRYHHSPATCHDHKLCKAINEARVQCMVYATTARNSYCDAGLLVSRLRG